MMRASLRNLTFFLVIALLAALLAMPAGAAIYLDLRADDARLPAVAYVTEKGLISGTSPSTFEPDRPLTRAMLCVVFSRLAEAELDDAAVLDLSDAAPGQWYTGAAAWALKNGVLLLRNGLLAPDEAVTRAEICVAVLALDRLTGRSALPDTSTLVFLDLGGFDSRALHAVAVCAQAGLVTARDDGRFAPYESVTRAEAAQTLYLYDQLSASPEEAVLEEDPSLIAAAGVTGWTGDVSLDFPLADADVVDETLVNWLNQRILMENTPARVSAYGTTIDGNPKHLTNYGVDGLWDCINVITILDNPNNGMPADRSLGGLQEYYGYALQCAGTSRQDTWHQEAQTTGKDPWQCTWWAWGRAAQYLDTAYGLDFAALCGGKTALGNGRDYYNSLKPYFLGDMTPSANSLISWSCGQYGHVAYVEAVDEGGIWISAADSGHTWRGVTYIPKSDSTTNPYPLNWFSGGERLNGFIHLDYAADGSPMG